MGKFSDALNSPLPSQISRNLDDELSSMGYMTESLDDVMDGNTDNSGIEEEGCNGSSCEGFDSSVDNMDIDDSSDEGDDFDPDDLSDEELAELDRELSDDAMGSVIGNNDDCCVDLSADEEMRADDMMNMAATTMLVNDELNAEEKAEFLESQVNVAIDEGFMTESDANEMYEELGLAQENSYNKKMIIRLDAAAKKKQLYALAVNVSAAAHGDPDYRKLRKVMKMRKVLRARLDRKYHAEATKRMKIYFARLKRSKSSALAKLGAKFSK